LMEKLKPIQNRAWCVWGIKFSPPENWELGEWRAGVLLWRMLMSKWKREC